MKHTPTGSAAIAGVVPTRPGAVSVETPRNPSVLRAAIPEPLVLRIPAAIRFSGLSRSGLYRAAGAGLIRMVKLGPKATGVDVASLRAYLARLPEAQIKAPVSRQSEVQ